MFNHKQHFGISTVAALLLTGSAYADGHDAVLETCNSCHGDNGVSRWTDMPTIAGLSEFYHADQLYLYRDGERPCSPSEYRQGDTSLEPATMCDVAAELSDEQIDALGAHYAEIAFSPAAQDFDAAMAAKGEAVHERDCRKCHSDGGANPDDDAGILSGQWMGYMRQSFAEYESGERDQPSAMKRKLDALDKDEIEALLHYYASQQ